MNAANASTNANPSRSAPIGVDEAMAIIRAKIDALDVVDVPLELARGHLLARDIVAPRNVPAFRNSAMDGYALLASATTAASESNPITFQVVGEIAAGGEPAYEQCAAGQAIRIMTGAPVPVHFDAVIQHERVAIERDRIVLSQIVLPGVNIREAGSELATGDLAISARQPLDWAAIGLLAALGFEDAPVHRSPSVAVISTGDEIVNAADAGTKWSVPDSNGPMLAAMISSEQCQPIRYGIAGDSRQALLDRLNDVGSEDAIVISGGVSAGEYDLVREVLGKEGEILFAQVRIKPGKPFAFGLFRGKPVFAVPGNPIAAAVTFEQFVRPALRRMRGFQTDDRPMVIAQSGEAIQNDHRRQLVVPVKLRSNDAGVLVAHSLTGRGATGLAALSNAHGLLVIPEEIDRVAPGDLVALWPIGARRPHIENGRLR